MSENRLKQKDVAVAAGISAEYLSKIINEKRPRTSGVILSSIEQATITTLVGTSPVSLATVVTVTVPKAYPTKVAPQITPANFYAARDCAMIYIDQATATTTTFKIMSSGTLSAGYNYVWNYSIRGY